MATPKESIQQELTGQELSTQSVMENDLIATSDEDELITLKETPEEIDNFKRYVRMFQMKNPRQIRRLRNSYRLLKVMENGEGGISLMFIIFLMEYLMEKASKTKIEKDRVVFDTEVFSNVQLNQAIEQEINQLPFEDLNDLAAVGLQVILPASHENQFFNT